jgi:hypothetical protein
MLIDQISYRKAFAEYLRKGTPIARSLKQGHPTTHYIWRTAGDGKVRPSHAANEGQVFAWDRPPPTGNPGDDFGCRCRAEPFDAARNEFVTIILTDVADTGPEWSSTDFVDHYYRGGGRRVIVRDTGHLTKIVARFMEEATAGLQKQIADAAREARNGQFSDDFYNPYGMTFLVFSIGDTVIGGRFTGRVRDSSGMLRIEGDIDFYLKDAFIDLLDSGVEAIDLRETISENIIRPLEDRVRERYGLPWTGVSGPGIHTGEPYSITDEWFATFEGSILADVATSKFVGTSR